MKKWMITLLTLCGIVFAPKRLAADTSGLTGYANGYTWTFTLLDGLTAAITGCTPEPHGDLVIPAELTLNEEVWKNGAQILRVPVSSVEDNAFSNNEELKSVTFPSSTGFMHVRHNAFGNCHSLTNVTFGHLVSIGSQAFQFCANLTGNLIIPNGVEEICSGAFLGCKGLEGVIVPNTVVNVGTRAFAHCSNIKAVTIPSCLSEHFYNMYVAFTCDKRHRDTDILWSQMPDASIEEISFADGVKTIESWFMKMEKLKDTYNNFCSQLKHVSFPDSLRNIGDAAFAGHSLLAINEIPSAVTNIGSEAFSGCGSISNVVIPSSMSRINSKTFYGCKALAHVSIPNSITDIGESAFYNCTNLNDVILPPSITSIGRFAFSGCSKLECITVPGSVKGIERGAFRSCSVLSQATIEDGVSYIGDEAFIGTSLTDISIPLSVTNIGNFVFGGNESLTSIEVAVNNPAYCSVNGLLLTKNRKTVLEGINGKVCIPDGVETIGESAFSNRKGLRGVDFPEGLEYIGRSAFNNCPNLHCVTMPSSILSIDTRAFYGCGNPILNVTFNSNAPVFKESGGEGSVFGQYSPSQQYGVGGGYGVNVYVPKDSSGWNVSGWLTGGRVIYYDPFNSSPIFIIENGILTTVNPNGATEIVIPEGVVCIERYAFCGRDEITKVTIPDSVKCIGAKAFFGCADAIFDNSTIEGVKLIDGWVIGHEELLAGCLNLSGVRGIAGNAFNGCIDLESVIIPDSVKGIGANAFSGCRDSLFDTTSIPGVKLLDGWAVGHVSGLPGTLDLSGVRGIGESAFGSCSEIYRVVIPESVKVIGAWAFSLCQNLTTVELSEGLEYIGALAFCYCTSLSTVTIPASVARIDANAFYSNGTGLKSITFNGNAPDIGTNAFLGAAADGEARIPRGNETYNVVDGKWQGMTVVYYGDTAPLPHFTIVDGVLTGVELNDTTSVEIPDSVTRIGAGAFLSCGELTSVTIPESVREISTTAFRGCANLTSITIPASVVNIEDGAFRDCSSLAEVYFEGNAPLFGALVFDGVADDCRVIVSRDSTGWNTTIPGIWNGLPIGYSQPYNEWGTIRKSLDVNDSVEIATSEPTSWFPVSDISARVGSGMARSAAVGSRTNSWLSASVSGSGTMAFWCKTSCEHDEDGAFARDCLKIYTNDVEIVEWRMDGETDWMQRAIEFLGGENTVKWVYYKDNVGSGGGDCAWIDGVEWMPDEPTNMGNVGANWFVERVSGYSEDEDLSARGYELSGVGSLSVVKGVRTAYLKVDMNSAGFASYTPNPAGRDRTVSTIVARIQAENVFTSMFDELPEVAGQQGGVCIVKCDGVNAWFGLTATGWRRLYSSALPPELGEWYDVRAEIDNRDSAARKVRYSAKHAEDSNFVILADEDDEIWLPNACATPIGKVSKICFGCRMNVGDFYGSQTPAANLIVSGNGEVSQGVNRGYVVVANEGRTLKDGDFSFSVAREAYVVVIASDGKSATVSLKPPVLASGQGEAAMSGDGEDADKDEDDPSGVLVDAADVVARFGTDAIKAIPTAKAGETIGVLPVKTYSGLYYRVSWGADLNNLISGDKVLARGDTLFLGVIKQTHGKGFYKITVSEQ